MNELGPTRNNLTDLTVAEISEKRPITDVAQSMADELSSEQLRNEAASLRDKIEQTQLAITLAQEELGVLQWKLGEVSRAQQLADDKNPGV